MMPAKICGLTCEEDILFCAAQGAYALGLVVEYPLPLPWNVTLAQAEDLRRRVPEKVDVCMVTGGKPDEIIARARRIRPHAVQLHFEETLAETAYIADVLADEGIRVVKALRSDPAGRLHFEIGDPAAAAKELSKTKVAALLVDSGSADRPGGSGITVNLDCYFQVAENTRLPVILAGGLKAENLHSIVPMSRPPAAVDVLTGVESSPGKKDREKVRAFLQAARSLSERTIEP